MSSEQTLVEVQATVYVADGQTMQWEERGSGLSKLSLCYNATENNYRILAMCEETKQYILNTHLYKWVAWQQDTPTFFQWADKVRRYGVNVSDPAQAQQLNQAMIQTIETLKNGGGPPDLNSKGHWAKGSVEQKSNAVVVGQRQRSSSIGSKLLSPRSTEKAVESFSEARKRSGMEPLAPPALAGNGSEAENGGSQVQGQRSTLPPSLGRDSKQEENSPRRPSTTKPGGTDRPTNRSGQDVRPKMRSLRKGDVNHSLNSSGAVTLRPHMLSRKESSENLTALQKLALMDARKPLSRVDVDKPKTRPQIVEDTEETRNATDLVLCMLGNFNTIFTEVDDEVPKEIKWLIDYLQEKALDIPDFFNYRYFNVKKAKTALKALRRKGTPLQTEMDIYFVAEMLKLSYERLPRFPFHFEEFQPEKAWNELPSTDEAARVEFIRGALSHVTEAEKQMIACLLKFLQRANRRLVEEKALLPPDHLPALAASFLLDGKWLQYKKPPVVKLKAKFVI